MAMLDAMKTDTSTILSDWGETLTVKRLSASYGVTGQATNTWNTQGTITGDWQPVSGSTQIAEAGLAVKSDSVAFAAFDADVQDGDRLYRADGTFEYVNYVVKQEDHIEIYLTRTKGSD